jgi:hypothetical protein
MIQSAAIQISPEILALVASIDEFKGAWRALGARPNSLKPTCLPQRPLTNRDS